MRVIPCLVTVFCMVSLSLPVLASIRAQPTQSSDRLDPSQPESYLRAGELRAALARNEKERLLAWQTLVLGAVFADRQGKDQLAASCCIALAESQPDTERYRYAWDLAVMLDPSRVSAWVRHRNERQDERSAELAAECLRLVRNAKPGDAQTLYQRAGVRETILRAAEDLGIDTGRLDQTLSTLMQENPNDDCRGRVFHVRVEDGVARRLLCQQHRYPIGSTGNSETLRMLLSIELACMGASGDIDSWGGAAAMHHDQPSVRPSFDTLMLEFGVDPSRPYLDANTWSPRP